MEDTTATIPSVEGTTRKVCDPHRQEILRIIELFGIRWAHSWRIELGARTLDDLADCMLTEQVTFKSTALRPLTIIINTAVVNVFFQDGPVRKELYESFQVNRSNGIKTKRENRGIAETMRKGEFAFAAAKRGLLEKLKWGDPSKYDLSGLKSTYDMDPNDSEEWPGLKAEYHQKIFDCTIPQELYDRKGYVYTTGNWDIHCIWLPI